MSEKTIPDMSEAEANAIRFREEQRKREAEAQARPDKTYPTPVSRTSTEDPHAEVQVHVHLGIADRDEALKLGVAEKGISIRPDEDENSLTVTAFYFEESHTGALRVAQTMELAAQAIRQELIALGVDVEANPSAVKSVERLAEEPKPRFNPQPTGRFNQAGEH